MGKISLRRFLSPKPLALIAAAVLLVSSVPLISSALTVDELLGQSGGAAATSSYPSITVTSSSNTSLLLKVTPLSFNGTNWIYQITWHRTLNAQGSVYVTLKSDKSQQVYSSDPAGQNDDGNQTMALSPSTGYRVEFWQQPGKGGSLLLRKFFTTLPAVAATTTTTTTTTTTSQSSTGATSVADQLAANPNGPANCFSSNWGSVQQSYSSAISKKLGDYYIQKYGSNDSSRLNDNDLAGVSLICSNSWAFDDFNHGLITATSSNVSHPLGLASYTRKGSNPVDTPQRYDIYMYYCGPANYQTPGFVDGSNNMSAFLNPPAQGLCANGGTASTPVLSLTHDNEKWYSISQADLGTAGWVRWDWTCTGPARPSSATKYQGYPGVGTNDSLGESMQAYSDWLDNKNGSMSHCAAPVYIVDTKYCGADYGQDFGSSPIPTKGLCANGGNLTGQVGFVGGQNSGQAEWVCAGPDYASSCHSAMGTNHSSATGGLSDTAPIPSPVCSYSPDQTKTLCLYQNYSCVSQDVCAGTVPLTTITDTSLPPTPAYVSGNTNIGIGGGR